MSLVVDASVLVAALIDTGIEGRWAVQIMASGELVAPHLALAETANILRRLQAAGRLEPAVSETAFRNLIDLPIDLQPFVPFADRVWQLKDNVTCYDAWYVALAEAFDLPLATFDRRLARAPGIDCQILTPPE